MASYGTFRKLGYLILGSFNKDPTIKGTRLRSPIFGNPHMAPRLAELVKKPGRRAPAEPAGVPLHSEI